MGRLIRLIMLYAPVGLGAYFAYIVATFGSELMEAYFRVIALYYPIALLYFAIGFSFYAFIASGKNGVKKFWMHIPLPALTAWGTGSSLAAPWARRFIWMELVWRRLLKLPFFFHYLAGSSPVLRLSPER
jgi:Na+/H+-dicarboxylate symporter